MLAGQSKRVVFTPMGSIGDINPFIAVARELNNRGHQAVIATHETYRDKVLAEGLEFAPLRPDARDVEASSPDVYKLAQKMRTGTEYVVRKMVLPHLRACYEDLLRAGRGADLMVTHTLCYAAQPAAEKLQIPFVGLFLQPITFFSIYDPPVLPAAPALYPLRRLGPKLYSKVLRSAQRSIAHWMEPVQDLRREEGLPLFTRNPLFDGQFSRLLNLALFSPLLAPQQVDWPANTQICGYTFNDREGHETCADPKLDAFLDAGPPPIVFTLGSAAVLDAGSFYEESIQAARLLNRRAVLLVGRTQRTLPPLPEGMVAFPYAPYSRILPRACAVVHQGGIGTTGQAMRAGAPMLVMPYSHDQPDNAARVMRLGIARVISRNRYRARLAAHELRRLLEDPSYAEHAAQVRISVSAEDGAGRAADAVEELLLMQNTPRFAAREVSVA